MLEFLLEKEIISRYSKAHQLLKGTRIKRVYEDGWEEIWIEIDVLGNQEKASEIYAEAIERLALTGVAEKLGMAKAIIITQNEELYSPPIGVSGE